MKKIKGTVLTIAGSDSSGGAGIQADIKTISSMGAYAASAITSITAQSTKGIDDILELPIKIIKNQIKSVVTDFKIDSVKIGMLYSDEIIIAVKSELEKLSDKIPIILDPVMISKDGTRLLSFNAINQIVQELFPISELITPNIPEAEQITNTKISSEKDLLNAGKIIISMGAKNVLLKGGHLKGKNLLDILFHEGQIMYYKSTRIETHHTHGTGCTFASGIATGLAQNLSLIESVKRAHKYVNDAIRYAPKLGKGKGPINHLVSIK